MKSTSFEDTIGLIDTLPTLPTVFLKVTELINDPKTSAAHMARVISEDQVQTARLLKLVNSAFYGFPRQVTTVTDAIALVGFNAIQNLILATSVIDLFASSKNRTFDIKSFWAHSLGCAVGAKVIAKYIRYEEKEELFVAGLLHDIGKVVENQYLSEDFAKVVQCVQTENLLMYRAEQELLSYTHTSIGKLLAQKWELPERLVEPIAYHHTPAGALQAPKQTAVIHLADIFARAKDLGYGGDHKMPSLGMAAWNKLELKLSAIEPIMEDIDTEYEHALALLAVVS